MNTAEKWENKKDFAGEGWNIFNRIGEKEMVFGVFCNGRGGVFEYQGTGRRTGVSVSESICFAQQGIEGTGARGGGV